MPDRTYEHIHEVPTGPTTRGFIAENAQRALDSYKPRNITIGPGLAEDLDAIAVIAKVALQPAANASPPNGSRATPTTRTPGHGAIRFRS